MRYRPIINWIIQISWLKVYNCRSISYRYINLFFSFTIQIYNKEHERIFSILFSHFTRNVKYLPVNSLCEWIIYLYLLLVFKLCRNRYYVHRYGKYSMNCRIIWEKRRVLLLLGSLNMTRGRSNTYYYLLLRHW